jgi:hypothetical protein
LYEAFSRAHHMGFLGMGIGSDNFGARGTFEVG